MNLEKIKIDDKLKESIENWLNAGYTVTLENYEPNEHGIVWTEISLDLNNTEFPTPVECSSYYYTYLGGIVHKESTSPEAWRESLNLVGGNRR